MFGLQLKLNLQAWEAAVAQALGNFLGMTGTSHVYTRIQARNSMLFDPEEIQHLHELFDAIDCIQNQRLDRHLWAILRVKNLTISQLHQRLEDHDEFILTRQSLYRYFNPNQDTNRFPNRTFMKKFGSALELSPKQIQHLDYLWQLCRLNRKNLKADP